jgi:nucleotide-binding universal stress UspA family protein
MIEYWGVEVTLLHIVEADQWPGRRQELDRLVAGIQTISRKLGGRHVTWRMERGVAGERVLEYARAHSMDLIAISARGSSGLRGPRLGSVTDQILAEASCHVWLGWNSDRSSSVGMYARRVACALAQDEWDEHILREAENISGDLQADLTVIQAVPLPGHLPLVVPRDEAARDAILARAKRRIEKLLRRFYAPADVTVEAGSHGAVVSSVIQSKAMGLLVTSNLREAILAAESECPVLRVATPISGRASNAIPEPEFAMAAGRSA